MLLGLQVWTCLEYSFWSTWCNNTALCVFFNPVLSKDSHRIFNFSLLPLSVCEQQMLIFIDISDRKTYFHVFKFKSWTVLGFPKKSQRIPEKFPKNSQRIPKEFPKNFQRISKEFPKNSQRIPKYSQNNHQLTLKM